MAVYFCDTATLERIKQFVKLDNDLTCSQSRDLLLWGLDNIDIVDLILAAANGWLKQVKNYKTDLNKSTKQGKTALIAASQRGQIKVVKYLLDNKAQIDLPGKNQRTAFHIAAENGHLAVIELLLEYGANINKQDIYGQTPIFLSILKCHLNVTKYLVGKGADTDILDYTGRNLLYNSAETDDYDTMEYLISLGLNVNHRTPGGYGPITIAANRGSVGMVRLLLRAGTDPNNDNAMISTAEYGQVEVVKLLLQAGSKIDNKDLCGYTALAIAEQYNKSEVVDLLKSWPRIRSLQNICLSVIFLQQIPIPTWYPSGAFRCFGMDNRF